MDKKLIAELRSNFGEYNDMLTDDEIMECYKDTYILAVITLNMAFTNLAKAIKESISEGSKVTNK